MSEAVKKVLKTEDPKPAPKLAAARPIEKPAIVQATPPVQAAEPAVVEVVEATPAKPADGALAVRPSEARAQDLREHRSWLLTVDHQTSVSYDTVLMTISAGALGIAVNLGAGKGIYVEFYRCALGLFTVSMLAMLISYKTCRRELRRKIDSIDQALKHGEREDQAKKKRRVWHEVTTTDLNRTALLALIAGICCLIAFAGMNF
jgi:hypothetical protein